MIDARLRSQNAYLTDMDQRVADASSQYKEPWFKSTLITLVGYFEKLLASSAAQGVEFGADQISAAGLPGVDFRHSDIQPPPPLELSAQVDEALIAPASRTNGTANWLIGCGLAKAFTTHPKPVSVSWVVAKLVGAQDVRIAGFIQGIRSHLSQPPEALLEGFAALSATVATDPSQLIYTREREVFMQVAKEWMKETDVAEVWRGRTWDHFNMHSDELVLLRSLCEPQPKIFTALCESLKLPPLIEGVLAWPSITMDFDCILSLLEVAPSTTESDGVTWNHNLVAPLLLGSAMNHLSELSWRQRDAEARAEATEIAELVRRLMETCLARSDGVYLAANWARHFIWMARTREEPDFDNMFLAVVGTMAQAGIGIEELQNLLNSHSTVAGLDAPPSDTSSWSAPVRHHEEAYFELLMLAALLAWKKEDLGLISDWDRILREFRHRLSANDNSLRDFGAGKLPSWRHYVISRAYLNAPEILKTWEMDWSSLASQRRKYAHWSYSENRDADIPSLFLGNVGLALIDWCLADLEHHREHAAPLWRVMFEVVLPIATHWSADQESWRSMLLRLFARYPKAVGGGEDNGISSDLWTCLDALGGDDPLVLVAITNLCSNGIPFAAFAWRNGEDSEIESRIRRFLDWDAASGSASLSPNILSFWKGQLEDQDQQQVTTGPGTG